MDLDALLQHMIEIGGSDLHLKVDSPPMVRVDGALTPVIGEGQLDDATLERFIDVVTARTPRKREDFYEHGDLDTAYVSPGNGRFRVNGYRQRGAISIAFRYIPKTVPSFEQLGLPAGVEKLADEHRGLILVTGATGSGKSTTLAAMIDKINRTRKQHIVTIEDPIEIVHDDKSCIVNQREVGLDTASYLEGLRRALRQDPDVILIGELRDEESARAALQAAESGHLVLSTMHTIDAAETVGRMIEFFPPVKQEMTRQVLAGVLRGVISQRLLPRKDHGRIAAVEVMLNTARIADLIREARTEEMPDAIEDGSFHLMQSFSQHLVRLVLDDVVDFETAAAAATNRHDFQIEVDQELRRKRVEEGAGEEPAEAAESPDERDDAVGLRVVG
ncbi:MAG TPA: type IV pilus twitching motility protein PilT [Gaiellaceae bacterium]|jgi:twitching motility protein PilT|nr:type IV pilus twitching motility protein PilT [Gaiellaceae bacterium]